MRSESNRQNGNGGQLGLGHAPLQQPASIDSTVKQRGRLAGERWVEIARKRRLCGLCSNKESDPLVYCATHRLCRQGPLAFAN